MFAEIGNKWKLEINGNAILFIDNSFCLITTLDSLGFLWHNIGVVKSDYAYIILKGLKKMLVYRSYAESFPATVVTKYKGGVLVSNAKDERFYIKCCLRPGTCVWCTLVKKDARFDYPLALLDSVEYAVA